MLLHGSYLKEIAQINLSTVCSIGVQGMSDGLRER
jgi:hypothetical protein